MINESTSHLLVEIMANLMPTSKLWWKSYIKGINKTEWQNLPDILHTQTSSHTFWDHETALWILQKQYNLFFKKGT